MRKCPKCAGEADLSHTRGFVEKRLLKRLKIRPFRCRECSHRFYRSVRSDTPGDKRHAAILAPRKDRGPKDHQEFQTLISELQQAEKEATLSDDGAKAQES